MKPQDCARWEKCSINVCPLDSAVRSRDHLRGERVCPFIVDYVGGSPSEYKEIIELLLPTMGESFQGEVQRKVVGRARVRERFSTVPTE